MYYAKNNIIVEIENSNPVEYAIFNPLSGSFDLMDGKEYEQLKNLEIGKAVDIDENLEGYLTERGYLYPSKAEEDVRVEQEYKKFQDEIADSQVQLLLIPTYGCNLACTYCYQHGIEEGHKVIPREVVDAFFNYAQREFGQKQPKPFVTLFGGEPLINSPAQRAIIEYIIDKCVEHDYELAAVTNGFDLVEYVDLLKRVRVKEIQVTLDGSRDVHDKRRGTANGKGTFERIVKGMEKAIEAKIPINFRTVLDNENIKDLVNLVEFMDNKGWLDLGQEFFKTQIGRNYELFECYAKPQHLLSQVELWAQFVRLAQEYPILKKFHRPDFKGIRHLVDTGAMYMASFDTCPAAKTEWVFDFNGEIYGCTASCGREEFKLGTFYPEVSLNRETVEQWQRRDVHNIEECRDCQYNVICGGGCGVVAANKNGKVLSPDCRPIQGLMELGVNYYLDDIKGAASDNIAFTSGCMLCGGDLVYNTQTAKEYTCVYCGKKSEAYVVCENGHYVCDDCHSKDVLGLVEEICVNSDLADPVELANQIFEIPNLNMHGPEYHSIVPAIIVTAYGNSNNNKSKESIHEAIRRGRDIKGGVCGTHGACGAAIGLGVAYSVLNQVSPLSKDNRGEANKLTAQALLEMSQYGGPRCCKRETVLTLETARKNMDGFENTEEAKYVCRQYKDNPDCIRSACPYFPKKKVQIKTLKRKGSRHE